MRKFKSKKNLLKEFIFNNGMKQTSEQTVKSLLRSIVEPVIENNSDGVVLFRLFDTKGLDGLLKRLDYSKAGVYFYSDMGESVINVAQDDIWEKTEFAIVLAPRYCASLVWDYSTSDVDGYTNICFYLNSRRIQDILKVVIGNSNINFMPDVEPYSLERRENGLMCEALGKVVGYLNETVLETHINTQTTEIKPKREDLGSEVRKIIHEIRNNLSVISLHSKIIEKRIEKFDEEAPSKILNAKSIIEKATKTISMLLDDLKSETEFKMEVLDVKDLVEMVLDLSEPRLLQKQINVETNLKSINVLVDETRALGVLLNIISNAVYALEQNGKLKVEVEENTDKSVSIIVENNGEAISQEIQKRIFEEGFTTKKETEGSGLGLKIAKSSMEKMDGDLRLIKSDENSTVFEIKMKKVEDGGVS